MRKIILIYLPFVSQSLTSRFVQNGKVKKNFQKSKLISLIEALVQKP